MKEALSVLVVDDHPVVRSGIARALIEAGFSEITQASSTTEAYSQIAATPPDALVIDVNLPDGNGLEVVTWMRSIHPTIPIVVLSFQDSDLTVLAALRSGASSFVSKSAPLAELVSALEHALRTPTSFSSNHLAQALARKVDAFNLSPREIQIVMELDRGLPNSEFAQSLFISEATLKTHLSSIYRKLGVKNRVQAISVARQAGIISAER